MIKTILKNITKISKAREGSNQNDLHVNLII